MGASVTSDPDGVPFPGGVLFGLAVDTASRCEHYAGETDIVALRLPCCGRWYPCAECHDAVAGHERQRWRAEDLGEVVACCGVCGTHFTQAQYRALVHCPDCGHPFNPGCRLHADRYFAS